MERRGGRNQRRRAPPASKPRGLTLIVGLVEDFNFLDEHNIRSFVCISSLHTTTSTVWMYEIHYELCAHQNMNSFMWYIQSTSQHLHCTHHNNDKPQQRERLKQLSPNSTTYTRARLLSVTCQSRVAAWYCKDEGGLGFVWGFWNMRSLFASKIFSSRKTIKHSKCKCQFLDKLPAAVGNKHMEFGCSTCWRDGRCLLCIGSPEGNGFICSSGNWLDKV